MASSREIEAVFLDIDDTMFSTTEFAENARRNAITAMCRTGLDYPVEDALQELREVIREFTSNDDSHFDRLLQRFPPETYAGVNPAVLVASAVIGYHQTKFTELKPFPDAVKALAALKRAGLLLGVITAGLAVKQAEKLLRLGLYEYFDPEAIFISDQIGISKPNQKLFLRACGECGIDPERAVYVGDDPINDIDPANAIGMVTFHVLRETPRARQQGATRPDYVISSFDELLTALRNEFAIDVAP